MASSMVLARHQRTLLASLAGLLISYRANLRIGPSVVRRKTIFELSLLRPACFVVDAVGSRG